MVKELPKLQEKEQSRSRFGSGNSYSRNSGRNDRFSRGPGGRSSGGRSGGRSSGGRSSGSYKKW